MNRFFEHYLIKRTGTVCAELTQIKTLGIDTVDFFPGKLSKIEKVVLVTNNSNGILFSSTPEYVLIKIEGFGYKIEYNSREK